MEKLPVVDTLKNVTRFFTQNWEGILKSIWALVLLRALISFIYNVAEANGFYGMELLFSNVEFVVNLFIFPIIAVHVYRMVFLNEFMQANNRLGFRWQNSETRLLIALLKITVFFIGLVVVFLLLLGIIMFIGSLIFSGGSPILAWKMMTVLAIFAAAITSLRFLMALPAAALGEECLLVTSWNQTKGHLLYMTLVFLFLMGAFFVVFSILYGIVLSYMPEGTVQISLLFILDFVGLFFMIVLPQLATAFIYQRLVWDAKPKPKVEKSTSPSKNTKPKAAAKPKAKAKPAAKSKAVSKTKKPAKKSVKKSAKK